LKAGVSKKEEKLYIEQQMSITWPKTYLPYILYLFIYGKITQKIRLFSFFFSCFFQVLILTHTLLSIPLLKAYVWDLLLRFLQFYILY